MIFKRQISERLPYYIENFLIDESKIGNFLLHKYIDANTILSGDKDYISKFHSYSNLQEFYNSIHYYNYHFLINISYHENDRFKGYKYHLFYVSKKKEFNNDELPFKLYYVDEIEPVDEMEQNIFQFGDKIYAITTKLEDNSELGEKYEMEYIFLSEYNPAFQQLKTKKVGDSFKK